MNSRRGKSSQVNRKSVQGLSVPIVRPHRGRYALDKQVVEEIFCNEQIAGMKVVVISMCGTMHCGKSLNLNFFYENLLRRKAGTSLRKSELPKPVFDWGNGIKNQRKTVGIYVTRKPVIFNRNGEQLAVFLLDSEGMNFESDHRQYFLFSLVTLLSSTQIINVEKDVADRDIYPLKPFFSVYDELKDFVDGNLFDNRMLFLVRDCANTLTCKLGEDDGGQFLSKSFSNGYKRTAYDKLKKTFSEVKCFIMPHPGSKAIVKQVKNEFLGTYQELNDSFVSYFEHLMDLVLSRDKLTEKSVNGRVLSCSDFKDYVEICYEALSKSEPTTGVLKLFAHTIYLPLLEDCHDFFKAQIEGDCKNAFEEEDFFSSWERHKALTLEKFESEAIGGPLNIEREDFRERLEQILDSSMDDAREQNDKFYKASHAKNDRAFRNSRKTYEEEFQTALNREHVDRETVLYHHQAAMAHAMALFERAPKQGGERFIRRFREELSDTLQKTLQDKLDEITCVEPTSNDIAVSISGQIGFDGGRLDHDSCSLAFPKASLVCETEISITMTSEANSWPREQYKRKSPVFCFEAEDRRIRKPVKCTLACWYISFSSDVEAGENLFVLQKKGETWVCIHSEVIERKAFISCNLTELSPVALAVSAKNTRRQIATLLYINTEGNFKAFFFDMEKISFVRDSAKSGRCMTMSELNVLEVNPRDEIEVSLSRASESSADTSQVFRGADVTSIKSITFCAPEVGPEERATKMQYEVKINGNRKIFDRFKTNLNNPGRPDTAPTGPLVLNKTNAVGDYLTLSTEL